MYIITKFLQKKFSQSKTGKMNNTIEFSISELISMSSFILNKTIFRAALFGVEIFRLSYFK